MTINLMDPPKKEVLDHGFVRLVDCMGSDLSIVRAARVSYDAEWRTGESESADSKLIGYLLRNKHFSPFESVAFTFEIKCPIFVARQWHRHWSWRFNEVSARYTELPEEFYIPELNKITTQSTDNKQVRTEEQHGYADGIQRILQRNCKQLFREYKELLEIGCPRELARSVLPLGTYTRFFGTTNLRSLLHFMDLRIHPHAQYEIRVYGEALRELVMPLVPITIQYWDLLRATHE